MLTRLECSFFGDFFLAFLGFRSIVLNLVSPWRIEITAMVSMCRFRLNYEFCLFWLGVPAASLSTSKKPLKSISVAIEFWQFEEEDLPGIYRDLSGGERRLRS